MTDNKQPGDFKQNYTDIPSKEELIARVDKMHKHGYRLGQISATRKNGNELIYSFSKGYDLENLRLQVADDEEIESISGIYPYSYLYENEIKDLFGVRINNINIDFKGTLYQTPTKAPFADDKNNDLTTKTGDSHG